MSIKPCDDCGQDIDFEKVDGRWAPVHPSSHEDHRLACTSDSARQWRIRHGKEAGYFPISPSYIGLYMDCPQRAADLYPRVDGQIRIPDRELTEGALGTVVHDYAAHRQRGEEPPLKVIPLEYVREFQEMTTIWDRQFEAGMWPVKGAAIEDHCLYEWDDESGLRVQLKVIIDRWEYLGAGAVLATDWKTGRKLPSEADLWKDIQAICTVIAMRRHPDLAGSVERAGFQLWAGRRDGNTIPYDEPIWFSAELLDAYEDALRRVVHAIITDEDFKPNPYCNICPVGRHEVVHRYPIRTADGGQVVIAPPENEEQAEELAGLIWAAKRVASGGMEALEPWAMEHGPVQGIGPHEYTSYEITDPEAAREVLIEAGRDKNLHYWFTMPGERVRSIMTSKRAHVRIAEELKERGIVRVVTKTKYEAKPPKRAGIVVDGVVIPDKPELEAGSEEGAPPHLRLLPSPEDTTPEQEAST